MSDDPGATLKAVCEEVISDPDLEPVNGKTFCNIGARRVAQALGCSDFDDESLMADDMVRIMENGGRWEKVEGSAATIHALGGGLAFAAMSSIDLGEAHGHLAAIFPVGMQYSGSFGCDVPMLANCGKQNGEEKTSQAFPPSRGMPSFFIWS